jgi:hypothetical protein
MAGIVLALLLAGVAPAEPPLTLIQDILYKADGSRFHGLLIIEWKTFDASDQSVIARNQITQLVHNGVLSVRLVPTTTAATSTYYLVKYVTLGSLQFTEAWAVRPSTTPLKVADIRIPDPILGPGEPPQARPILIEEVTGLRQELDARARIGSGYTTDRAAWITSSGELAGVSGAVADCVKVDGTSGPCGTGGGGPTTPVPTFVDFETPAGLMDGSNAVFTLSQVPNPPESLQMFRNGLLQKQSVDFSLSGNAVTFIPAAVPTIGDILLASFRVTGAGGSPVPGFVDAETPSGVLDGSNLTFTLAQSPYPASSLVLFRNGLFQKSTVDYSVTGNTISFLPESAPQTGDILLASYRLPGTTGTMSQVICAGTGSSTSQTTATSLGSCLIPANTLRSGDRVEIFFDYVHQGSATGFEFEVLWGSSALVSRSAGAPISLATGQASVGIYSGSAQWNVQSWGSAGLGLAADSGTSSENLSGPLTISLRGWMASSTSDTIALRNFTVVRHPAP